MYLAGSAKTVVPVYQTSWCHIPDGCKSYYWLSNNLKPQTDMSSV